jgi:hypothetical protein
LLGGVVFSQLKAQVRKELWVGGFVTTMSQEADKRPPPLFFIQTVTCRRKRASLLDRWDQAELFAAAVDINSMGKCCRLDLQAA